MIIDLELLGHFFTGIALLLLGGAAILLCLDYIKYHGGDK